MDPIEQFKKGIIMPPEQPVEEPMVEEEPEHPNTPMLEHILMNQDQKSTETNTLLEHILITSSDKQDETNKILEHNLVTLANIKDEIKTLGDEIKKSDEIWDIKLILE